MYWVCISEYVKHTVFHLKETLSLTVNIKYNKGNSCSDSTCLERCCIHCSRTDAVSSCFLPAVN